MALAFNGKGGGGGGGSSLLLVAKTTLTNAQVLALPTTALQLIAAPGANKMLLPVAVTLGPVGGPGTAYTNVDGFGTWGLYYDIDGTYTISANLSNVVTLLATHPPLIVQGGMLYQVTGQQVPSIVTANMVNQPVYLWTDNGSSGNLTGGAAGNTLPVTVAYFVADVS